MLSCHLDRGSGPLASLGTSTRDFDHGVRWVMVDGERPYQDRSDSAETKLRLLATAREQGDYRQALALADSLRDGLEAEWRLGQGATAEAPALGSASWRPVAELPAPWSQWAAGWSLFQAVALAEAAGEARQAEPVDVVIAVPAGAVGSLVREVRVARVDEATGMLHEVPSQVHSEARRREPGALSGSGAGVERGVRQGHLVWQADVPAGERTRYLVFAGNPAAELPEYPTDLRVRGEGFALDVENAHFVASLSRQMGQLERLTYTRAHGVELFAGGEGHGEPPHIDWAHDYLASGGFQKFRVTNWETCREYEVVRGPLCVTALPKKSVRGGTFWAGRGHFGQRGGAAHILS